MNKIINLFAWFSGANKVVAWLDGRKSYLSAAALILSGAAGLLTEVVALKDAAAIFEFAKKLPQDQALQLILNGLGILGLRHAIGKQEPVKG